MSIPNIDFFDKLITFLGLAIVMICSWFIYTEYNSIKQAQIDYGKYLAILTNKYEEVEKVQKSYIEKQNRSIELKKELLKNTKKASFKYTDSLFRKSQLADIIDEQEYKSKDAKISITVDSLKGEINTNREVLDIKLEIYQREFRTAQLFLILGFSIFILGIYRWSQKDEFEKRLLYRQNLDKPEFSNECQSCGKNFDSFIVHGAESNGQKNFHYCNGCYKNGELIPVDLNELKKNTKNELTQNGFSDDKINKILKRLERLDRWKKNRYSI